MDASGRSTLDAITNTGELNEATEEAPKQAIVEFKGSVAY